MVPGDDGDKNDDNKCDGEMPRSSDDGDKNDDSKCDGMRGECQRC